MADKKISQLTALSAANVASATDVLAIVDTSATETKKITAKDLIDGALNGGTANGVLYLNGSKVATSGSALVFDGTNLGIGTASPATLLDLGTSTGQKLSLYRNANIRYGFGIETDTLRYYVPTGVSNAVHSFGAISTSDGTTYTERGRFTAGGNFLVGDSTSRSALNKTIELSGAGTSTGQSAFIVNQYVAAGNATNTGYLIFQRSGSGTLGTNSLVANDDRLGMVRFSGANGTGYDAAAEIYGEIDGTPGASSDMPGRLVFATTSNGAGGTTERARITSGGNLLVATTDSDETTGPGLKLIGSTTIAKYRVVTDTATSGETTFVHYNTNATNNGYRFYVTAAGTINAITTTISAISDQRLKENVRDLDVGLDAVMALKPRKFDWKEGKGKDIKNDRGFIAQEFEQVFPDLIDEWKDPAPEGEEPYKSVRQDLIPVLVKAMQEQQSMIEELKAKVAALEAQ